MGLKTLNNKDSWECGLSVLGPEYRVVRAFYVFGALRREF